MDGMLSQDEINALLNGMSLNDSAQAPVSEGDSQESTASTIPAEERLTPAEIDALGEVANISMGTAATTLSSLLNQKVMITTPNVAYATWDDVSRNYFKPCVLLKISYVEGLTGDNVLILKEDDVKIITNLMMGGSGEITDEPLGELHLSAIGEAMNQMMGSASTSMSSMLNKRIDISPPVANLVDLAGDDKKPDNFDEDFVQISFQMQIGDLIDSQIMQLYPIAFAKDLYIQFMKTMTGDTGEDTSTSTVSAPQVAPAPAMQQAPQPAPAMQPVNQPQYQQPMQPMQPMQAAQPYPPQGGYYQPGPQTFGGQAVDVAPAAFQPFAGDYVGEGSRENIGLIMDVPLEVTVELGRTKKSIKEILEFAPGAILELNKIAGEPVDVLVNGKYVAKGEVVVIEESFGVRISEIISNKPF